MYLLRFFLGTINSSLNLPANNHELGLRWIFPYSRVDVDSEKGTTAIEDWRQRTHEGGKHYGQHETTKTCKLSEWKLLDNVYDVVKCISRVVLIGWCRY